MNTKADYLILVKDKEGQIIKVLSVSQVDLYESPMDIMINIRLAVDTNEADL